MSFLFVAETLIYYICLIMISIKLLDGKIDKTVISIGSSIIYLVCLILASKINYIDFSKYLVVFLFLQLFVLCVSIKNVKISYIIYAFVLLFCLGVILTSSIISFFSSTAQMNFNIEILVHLLILCLCLIVCFLPSFSKKVKNILIWTSKSIKILTITLMIFSMVITTIVFDIQEMLYDNIRLLTLYRIITVSLLFIFLTLSVLLLNSISNMHLKSLTKNYEKQLEAQAEHYAVLSRTDFELRRFRHDFNNIKLGVGELIAEGRPTEAIKMLDCANGDIYNTTNSLLCFDTGNGIVDALLAEKQRNAALSNIKIKFEGAVPSSSISATELCVLFGNTIDNAIEACEKINIENEKTINVTCKCNSNFMFLDITNPVSKPIVIKNNTLATTKADKTLHGFGLYSLDQIVRKHDGVLSLSYDNYEFKVNISMFVET